MKDYGTFSSKKINSDNAEKVFAELNTKPDYSVKDFLKAGIAFIPVVGAAVIILDEVLAKPEVKQQQPSLLEKTI